MTKYEIFLADTKHPETARQHALHLEAETTRELFEKIAEHERRVRPYIALPYDLCIIVHEPGKLESIAVIQRRDTGLHVLDDSGIPRREPAFSFG